MLIASASSFFFAFLFHFIMGKRLGPSDYGVLFALLSVFIIITTPVINSLQLGVAKQTATFNVDKEFDKIRFILCWMIKRAFVVFVLVSILVAIASPAILDFLKIESIVPLICIVATLPFIAILAVTRGVLRGIDDYKHLAPNVGLEKAVMLVLGIMLVFLGFGIGGALVSYGLAALIMFIISLIPLKSLLREKGTPCPVGIYRDSWLVFFASLCLTTMVCADQLLVKHFCDSEEAGYFAAVSQLGKVIFYSSMALGAVLLPKVSARQGLKEAQIRLLNGSLLYMGLISTVLLLFYLLAPSYCLRYSYGAEYLPGSELMGIYGIAMALLSFSVILIYYNISIDQSKFLYGLIGCTFLEIVLLIFFQGNLTHMIWVLITTFSILLIINISLNLKHITMIWIR